VSTVLESGVVTTVVIQETETEVTTDGDSVEIEVSTKETQVTTRPSPLVAILVEEPDVQVTVLEPGVAGTGTGTGTVGPGTVGYLAQFDTEDTVGDGPIWMDGDDLVFEDVTAGQLTLVELSCPPYIRIKAQNQTEGDLHLSGAGWAVSKAQIKMIRVITVSTDWDLWVLQNDNGYVADDAAVPALQLMEGGYESETIFPDLPYEDEDGTSEVHLYYQDNGGAATADLILAGFRLR
jgi:hypothetical protein